MVKYDINAPWKTLDPWQKKYIDTDGNCILFCCRQGGKSTAISIKFGERAVKKKNRNILMLAFTENQAYMIFFKTLMYLQAKHPKLICKGKDKPTKHIIHLTNGSKIMCYAAGKFGQGVRGHTVTDLVVDEAPPMDREVFIAISPMLSVTGGTMDLSGTPKGKQGYFFDCSKKKSFTKFHITAEQCPRHSKEFLEEEKNTMSKLEYAQEYLAMFLEDVQRMFTDEWIKNVCRLRRRDSLVKDKTYYMGVDIARMGEDASTFEILEKINNNNYEQVESIVTKKTLTTQTEQKIIELETLYDFKEIYIDAGSGSLGVGIFDHLLDVDCTKRKVVAINNRKRPLNRDGTKEAKLLKEDLYNNLVSLGERGEIKLLDDDELIDSLKSIQWEVIIKAHNPSTVRIFGNNSHIAEGLVRAAWASKDKRLKLWVR